ncbi:RNA polymerase sigma factor [Rhodobacteraceae bacterium NNCM2]|nr:RNA polymerase sigma factor [Coraliihabitans acroporae]
MIRLDPEQVEAARRGDRAALDGVVRAAERPVFNLAMRMLAHRADAEDAAQEILVKIVTHLGTLREPEAAGGWAMRIACRHLVGMRRQGRVEAMRLTFEGFAADLERGLSDASDRAPDDPESRLAIEEVKVGCTLAMLTCLGRNNRIAYLLGEVFELTDAEAAAVLEITPAAYRQRLRRSRSAVTAFVLARCGNVSSTARCRCERRVAAAEASGRLVRGATQFDLSADPVRAVPALRAHVQRLEQGRRTAALLRSNPDFSSRIADLVMATVDRSQT